MAICSFLGDNERKLKKLSNKKASLARNWNRNSWEWESTLDQYFFKKHLYKKQYVLKFSGELENQFFITRTMLGVQKWEQKKKPTIYY